MRLSELPIPLELWSMNCSTMVTVVAHVMPWPSSSFFRFPGFDATTGDDGEGSAISLIMDGPTADTPVSRARIVS